MGFSVKRRKAHIDRLPEFEALREEAKAIKEHALAHLDFYLEEFERKAIANRRPMSIGRAPPAEAREPRARDLPAFGRPHPSPRASR